MLFKINVLYVLPSGWSSYILPLKWGIFVGQQNSYFSSKSWIAVAVWITHDTNDHPANTDPTCLKNSGKAIDFGGFGCQEPFQ